MRSKVERHDPGLRHKCILQFQRSFNSPKPAQDASLFYLSHFGLLEMMECNLFLYFIQKCNNTTVNVLFHLYMQRKCCM